ncbi:MAG: hypothetical protein Fur0023_16180 [Bacteroidia bacterium]
MKKRAILIKIVSLSLIKAIAQNFEVTTQIFDLEKENLHKGYKMFSGFLDNSGNYVVKLGKAACEMGQGSGPGLYDVTYYYYGVSYTFNELKFDKNFNYLGKEEKFFPTTIQTLPYEPVCGKYFWPVHANIFFKKPFSADYLGTKVLAPTYGFTGSIVKSFIVGGVPQAPWGGRFGTNYYSCSERIELQGEDKIKAKENKGERWMIVDHYPIPNGSVIAWMTDAIKDNTDKANFILKKYNENLEELAKVRIMVDYKSTARIMPIDRKNGKRDFAVIVMAQTTRFSPGEKEVDLREGILFILNGDDLSIKSESPFKMVYTQWYIEELVLDDEGNMYIMGTTSDSEKDNFTAFSIMNNMNNSVKKHPYYQLLKADANGKVQYVKAYTQKEEQSKIIVVPGIDKKVKPQVIFNTYDFLKDIYFTDKYVVIAGQQCIGLEGGSFYTETSATIPAANKENLFLAVIDKNTGELIKYFVKPEDSYGSYDIVFDKNQKNLYWATYSWEKYNDVGGEVVVSPDKFKGRVLGEVYLSKIDLNTLTATNFVNLGGENWGVSFDSPMLIKDNNSDYIVFQGRTLNKKAKDSELVFVKVKK